MKIKEEHMNRFVYAMFNLMHGMKKGVESCSAMCGNLSEKEFLIINFVGQNQNVKMSDIAENLSAPLSTLTSIIDKLVEKKYLARYHSTEDRRVILVTLASNGKDTCQTFMAKKQEMAEKVLSHFDEQEQENLIQHLEIIPSLLNDK